MKAIEKNKAQKIVGKIQSGYFDENDLDSLFMRLRAYSNGKPVFREIADFVAHNDKRDRGLANSSLETMYLRMKYFLEYNSPQKSLDISTDFPVWIKKLMMLQVDKFDENELKSKFNVTKQRLKSRIDNGFKENKKEKTASLKQGKLSEDTLKAIQHVMSVLISKPAFTQDDLIDELVDVISINNIPLDKESFLAQADKIALCTMLLLHNATFDYKGHKLGYTKISPEKESISFNTRFVDANGNEVENIETYGNLHVNGYVVLESDGKDLTIVHPIMTTKLDAELWCENDMFHIETWSEDFPDHLCKKLKISDSLSISNEFKLAHIAV
ncbi:hypothetical protein A6E12_11720 [Aliivibrio fischeri]|uniref:hypothetical protein n=1 Tax=Aliivibrio fischeri TaxID=668 RepID=UPI00080DB17C|nr:hypothetical protein [Aliivibrio fischeri]OCH27154.1 hypothetical protein A6E12_11720 [Aliivibrio fischeri]